MRGGGERGEGRGERGRGERGERGGRGSVKQDAKCCAQMCSNKLNEDSMLTCTCTFKALIVVSGLIQ